MWQTVFFFALRGHSMRRRPHNFERAMTINDATRGNTPFEAHTEAPKPQPARRKSRPRSAKTTRENILRAAKKIFSKDGYDGARVDKISKAAKSYDSLIYYYFGSKEKLFVEVLEAAYKDMFDAEQSLDLDMDDPVGSLRKLVEFPLRYYIQHPEII